MTTENDPAWDDHRQGYLIDPELARVRRGPHWPRWLRLPCLGTLECPVLFVAEQPERVDDNIHKSLLIQYGLTDVAGLTFLSKYPGYLTAEERRASAEYVKDEIIRLQPRVLVAMGNPSMKFLLRYAKEDEPPVTVCHGQRFETPRGKPVIAALPPSPVFAVNRVRLAYETAAYTLKSLEEGEFHAR